MQNSFDDDIDGRVLQALIFDVDGTLADTDRDLHRVAFNRAFRQAGLDWYWDVPTYGRLLKIPGGAERIRHYVRSALPDAEVALGTGLDLDAFARELHASKTEIYLGMLGSHHISPRPGVVRLLRQARGAGFRLAIATTTAADNVAALIASVLGEEALRWFEVIGAGDAVPNKKPAPDIYRYVLDRLQLPPSACFAFEDTASGLRASLGAGLRTIVTPTVYTVDGDFSGAWSVLSDLGESSWPCHCLGGKAPEHGLIDCEQLDAWHAETLGARAC